MDIVALIIFFILALSSCFFVMAKKLKIIQLEQDHKKNIQDSTNSYINSAKQKSNLIVHQAQDYAKDLLDQAEVDALKSLTQVSLENKLFSKELEKEVAQLSGQAKQEIYSLTLEVKQKLTETHQHFKNDLDLSSKDLSGEFKKSLEGSYKSFEKFLSSLMNSSSGMQKQVDILLRSSIHELILRFESNLKIIQDKALGTQQETENTLKAKVNELLLRFEQNLSHFLSSSQQQSLEAINLEVKSARQLIETYKAQQLALIDENIIAVLERTLSLVLKDSLNLKEHTDLVYESLEKAKQEKFFV